MLLPIAAFLCACPALFTIRQCVSAPVLLFAALGTQVAIRGLGQTIDDHSAFSSLLLTDLPLLRLVADGVIGFALGGLWVATSHRARLTLALGVTTFTAGSVATLASIPVVGGTAATVLHFIIILSVGAGLDRTQPEGERPKVAAEIARVLFILFIVLFLIGLITRQRL